MCSRALCLAEAVCSFITWWYRPQFGLDYLFMCEALIQGERNDLSRGAWVAQSVEHPTSARVMISRLVSSSPASGSVLTAWSLEPTSDSVSPPLSAPPLLMLCLALSLNNE